MKPTIKQFNSFIRKSLPWLPQLMSLAFIVWAMFEPDRILSALYFIAAGVWQVVAKLEDGDS